MYNNKTNILFIFLIVYNIFYINCGDKSDAELIKEMHDKLSPAAEKWHTEKKPAVEFVDLATGATVTTDAAKFDPAGSDFGKKMADAIDALKTAATISATLKDDGFKKDHADLKGKFDTAADAVKTALTAVKSQTDVANFNTELTKLKKAITDFDTELSNMQSFGGSSSKWLWIVLIIIGILLLLVVLAYFLLGSS